MAGNSDSLKIITTEHNNNNKILWDAAKADLKKSQSYSPISRNKKISMKQPNFTFQGLEKKRTKSRVTGRNEIIKIRA